MPHFLKLPNLPTGQVTVVAVGEDYSNEIAKALLPFGVKTLSCTNNSFADKRLRSHIDLSIFHLGENRFVLSRAIENSGFADELKRMGACISISDSEFSSEYPNDAFLCALSNGDKVFHNAKFCDSYIKNAFQNRLIHVNQGYAKCAVCLVNEKAAITADSGLCVAMEHEGIEVLKIENFGIELSGFNEGFIGGASFKIAPDKLAFTGVFSNCKNNTVIEDFLQRHGITPIYLTEKPIFDIGSVVPIIQI